MRDSSSLVREKGRLLGLPEKVDPAHTALVVIDVQNDFCHPAGLFGSLGHDVSMMPPMAEALGTLLAEARRRHLIIVFVKVNEDGCYLGAPVAETYMRRGFSESMCLEGSFGAQWYAGIAPGDSAHEIELTKHRFSAFGGTSLDLHLRSHGVKTVILTGVVTSGCVESSVRDAFFLDYYVVVPTDCVAEASEERHRASLTKITQAFGTVVPSTEIAAAWRQLSPPGAVGERLPASESGGATGRVVPAAGSRTALVLLELQNDFCHPEGAMAGRGAGLEAIQATLPSIGRLLDAAREAGVIVIHVKAEYGTVSASQVSHRLSERSGMVGCCEPSTWGGDFLERLAPCDDDFIVGKHRTSAFADTRLDLLLRAHRIQALVIVGVQSHGCVQSTAREASDRDYEVVIPRECVAAWDTTSHLHAPSLEFIERSFGRVVSMEEIVIAWGT